MDRFACSLLRSIVLWAALAAAQSARGELLAVDSFDGPGSRPLVLCSGGRGWVEPWRGGEAKIEPAPSELLGTPWAGNWTRLGTAVRVHRRLDVSPGGALDRAGLVSAGRIGRPGSVLYLSFFQRTSRAGGVYYAVETNTTDADGTRSLEIGCDNRTARPFYGAASVVNNGLPSKEPGQFHPLGAETTGANFLVVKFRFGSGEADRASVYRNPGSVREPDRPDAELVGRFAFDRIALANFNGDGVHEVGEIRLGTSYSDVFTPADPARRAALEKLAEHRVRQRLTEVRQAIEQLRGVGIDAERWQTRWEQLAAAAGDPPAKQLAAAEALAQSLHSAVLPARLARSGVKLPPLLFVKRHALQPSHIYTEYSDGPYRPGGGIFVLDPPAPDGQAKCLFDAKGGICRDPDISYDARRVLFSYRSAQDDFYHIYEVGVDGSGLRQVTNGPFHDLDPFYLPDGRIGFTSTRCKSRALCFWVQAATLFVMDAQGTRIEPLTANNVNEFTPDMLPDGRILYTRWEYMDKSAIFVQSLWAIQPDGTRAQQVFGNNMIHPVSMLQARLIPGTRKIACVLAAHNGNSYGPLAVIDPSQGVDNPAGILNLAPEVNYARGCFAPYPLSKEWTLVSYGPDEPFGIYVFGLEPAPGTIVPQRKAHQLNEPQFPSDLGKYWASAATERYLVYRDSVYSCMEAMPIAARPLPFQSASSLPKSTKEHHATLVLADVYQGLDGAVPRGRIKYLRVVEEMGHRDDHGQRDYCNGVTAGHFGKSYPRGFMSLYAAPWENGKPAPSLQAKYVFGTVPVEPDGSAHFYVPADRPIYFQALDGRYNEIQRMRSYVHLKAGQRESCVGCHEPRHTAPPNSMQRPLALLREPSPITPPVYGAGAFSYQRLVQPIFDRHCMACHGETSPAGGVELSGRRDGRGVPASFSTLVRPRTGPNRSPLVDFFDSWWGTSWTVPAARPLRFGSAVSRLVEVLDRLHEGIPLREEDRRKLPLAPLEREIITTWIDLNCPLWDNYSPSEHVQSASIR